MNEKITTILPEDNTRREWYLLAIDHGFTEDQATRYAAMKAEEEEYDSTGEEVEKYKP